MTFGNKSKVRAITMKSNRIAEIKDHYMLSRVTAFDELDVPFEVDESYD